MFDFFHRKHKQCVHLKLDTILGILQDINSNEVKQMATLDEVKAAVDAEVTLVDGLVTFIGGLKQQITDALANSGISAADQAKIDAIFAEVEADKTALTAALTNTPTT